MKPCHNCLEQEATEVFKGYDVCEDCSIQAQLPRYLRRNQ